MKTGEKRTPKVMQKNNVILIGMPGVGKSTAGVVLAKILGYHFVDADIVIQQKEGRLLRDIIEAEGVDGFIAIENKINSEIEGEKTVISTGGSVVYGKEAMEHYRKIGTVVFLKLDFESLKERLGDIKNRGVVLREGQDLKALYEERTPLYEQYADVIIDEKGLNVEETIGKLVQELKK